MGKKDGNDAAFETKQERFVRIVEPRIARAIKALRMIGKCASANYEYTAEQVQTMLAALLKEVERLGDKYRLRLKNEDDEVFTFKR